MAAQPDPPRQEHDAREEHGRLNDEPQLPDREEVEAGGQGGIREDQKGRRVLIDVDGDRSDVPVPELARFRNVHVALHLVDVQSCSGKSRGFRVQGQAGVFAKELPVRRSPEIGPRRIDHEPAEADVVAGRGGETENEKEGDRRPEGQAEPDQRGTRDGPQQQRSGNENDRDRSSDHRHAASCQADDQRGPTRPVASSAVSARNVPLSAATELSDMILGRIVYSRIAEIRPNPDRAMMEGPATIAVDTRAAREVLHEARCSDSSHRPGCRRHNWADARHLGSADPATAADP